MRDQSTLLWGLRWLHHPAICKQLGVYLGGSCRRLLTPCCSQLLCTAAHKRAHCWRPAEESCASANTIELVLMQKNFFLKKSSGGQYVPYCVSHVPRQAVFETRLLPALESTSASRDPTLQHRSLGTSHRDARPK